MSAPDSAAEYDLVGAHALAAAAQAISRDLPWGWSDAADWEFLLAMPSAATRTLVSTIRRTAPARAHVLVSGEPGTGKMLAARAIHALSRLSDRPLIRLNVGDIPASVFESALFGHEPDALPGAVEGRPGAFEDADGATLLLDEIGNLPRERQARLYRALTTGEFERQGGAQTRRSHPRVIAVTNVDLHAEVRAGRFSRELLERLTMLRVEVPPLRERLEDLPLLAHQSLQNHAARLERSLTGFDARAIDALAGHGWPGNVRELDHTIACAAMAAPGPLLTADDLGLRAWCERSPRLEDLTLADAERLLIRRALIRFNGNVKLAAGAVGIKPSELLRRRQVYGF